MFDIAFWLGWLGCGVVLVVWLLFCCRVWCCGGLFNSVAMVYFFGDFVWVY